MVYVSELYHNFGFGTSTERFPATPLRERPLPQHHVGGGLRRHNTPSGSFQRAVSNRTETKSSTGLCASAPSRLAPYPIGEDLAAYMKEVPALLQRYLKRRVVLDHPRPPRPHSAFARAYVPAVQVPPTPPPLCPAPSPAAASKPSPPPVRASSPFITRRESRTSWIRSDLYPEESFCTVGSTLAPPRQSAVLQYQAYDSTGAASCPPRVRPRTGGRLSAQQRVNKEETSTLSVL